MGSFICQHCGKEFAHYSKTKQEKGRKYCKECAKNIVNKRKNIEYNIIKCIDCDIEVKVDKLDHKTCRCFDCQEKRDSELHRIRNQKYKAKIKSDGNDPNL